MNQSLTIWSNARLTSSALELLKHNSQGHRLLFSDKPPASNLVAGSHDPLLAEADVAFGQPNPQQLTELPNVKWIQLTSAGYTRYDTPNFRSIMQLRGAAVTNSSSVFDAPCAEHILAMMMSLARRLPQAIEAQRGPRDWDREPIRMGSRLLDGQTAIIYGLGAIARRLVELLTPLRLNLIGVRRTPRAGDPIRTITPAEADTFLPQADHVINILPEAAATENFFTADRLARIKPTANFYNIGRGPTVDQYALQSALQNNKLAAAYLDVTTPEPLPPHHPLWTTPNCYITPHTAGGHDTEFERLVEHFTNNLRRFTTGEALLDRVV